MYQDRLPRRCSLGLELRARGLEVLRAVAGGTAEAAGVAPGDRLVAVDGAPLEDGASLARAARALSPGREVVFTVERDGARLSLGATACAAPVEAIAGAEVELGEVTVDGARLRTFLTMPSGAARAAALLLPGLGHASCELPANPADPQRALIEGLTSLGLATLRIERSGTGDSDGPPFAETDLFADVRAYRAGLDALLADRRFDRVLVFGQSVGGMIAPLLAAEGSGVGGVVVFGTTARPWVDAIVRGTRTQRRLGGAAEGPELEAEIAAWEELHVRACRGGRTPAEIFAEAPHLARLEGPSCTGRALFGRDVAFFQQLERLDLPALWRTVEVPVLSLAGEYDWVCAPEDGREVAAHAPRGAFVALPAVGHDMLRHASLERSFAAPREGEWDGSVLEALGGWLARGD